jgi:hypothetical protein
MALRQPEDQSNNADNDDEGESEPRRAVVELLHSADDALVNRRRGRR